MFYLTPNVNAPYYLINGVAHLILPTAIRNQLCSYRSHYEHTQQIVQKSTNLLKVVHCLTRKPEEYFQYECFFTTLNLVL